MKSHSFEINSCKEVIGDERTRTIESKARADADADQYNPPPEEAGSYWSQVKSRMEELIYATAYGKRIDRNERIKDGA